MNQLYESQTRITYYDLDYRGKIKLSALLRMVHVAADVNAKTLGAGYDTLAPLGITFVLQRFGVSITRMPNYDEDVTIRTWPSDISKGTFLRRGDMYDKNGIKLMEWASLWLLFDINARRVLRPSALPVPLHGLGAEGVKIMPEKIAVPENFGRPFSRYTHIVSYRDVDTNMHMNNSMYGDLVGNAIFPASEANAPKQDWKQVQINYLAEIRFGEEVVVSAAQDGDSFIVTGESGGRTAFVARVD
ncbi:MAG: thioesterase [Defluviitaleaceae bacterium]|nr:thioesterase [Defluviitaleaceae bacterium]